MVYWSWSDRRYISPVSVCEGVVAMVMVGESARWQCGSLLEDFGHDGIPDSKTSAQSSRGTPRALWGLYH